MRTIPKSLPPAYTERQFSEKLVRKQYVVEGSDPRSVDLALR